MAVIVTLNNNSHIIPNLLSLGTKRTANQVVVVVVMGHCSSHLLTTATEVKGKQYKTNTKHRGIHNKQNNRHTNTHKTTQNHTQTQTHKHTHTNTQTYTYTHLSSCMLTVRPYEDNRFCQANRPLMLQSQLMVFSLNLLGLEKGEGYNFKRLNKNSLFRYVFLHPMLFFYCVNIILIHKAISRDS